MKASKFITIAAILLFAAGSFYSCKGENEPEEIQSEEISFTEYSLDYVRCGWKNLNYDDKVIIVNSKNDLEKYVMCNEGSFTEFDFSKNTLLLTSGKDPYSTGAPSLEVMAFLKRSDAIYDLNVNFVSGVYHVTGDYRGWNFFITVPKISDDIKINLNTNYVNYKP